MSTALSIRNFGSHDDCFPFRNGQLVASGPQACGSALVVALEVSVRSTARLCLVERPLQSLYLTMI